MNSQIDYKKMMAQEPEFDKYVKTVLTEVMLSDPNVQGFLQSIHAFYQVGNTTEQTVQIIKEMLRFNR